MSSQGKFTEGARDTCFVYTKSQDYSWQISKVNKYNLQKSISWDDLETVNVKESHFSTK